MTFSISFSILWVREVLTSCTLGFPRALFYGSWNTCFSLGVGLRLVKGRFYVGKRWVENFRVLSFGRMSTFFGKNEY